MTFELFTAFLIFTTVTWFVCSPLISPQNHQTKSATENQQTKALQDLKNQKNEVLLSLKELELDFHTKKISQEDYNSFQKNLMQQGTSLLKEIKSGNKTVSNSMEYKKTVSSNNAKQALFCSQCGHELQPEAKFCSQCGFQATV